MAITAQERAEILELVVLMFDAAPGAYLTDIVAVYEANGRSLQQLARILGNTAAFQALHPNFQVADEFAADFLSTLGLQDDEAARDWVVMQFNAGVSKADIMFTAWQFLDDLQPGAAQQYLDARAVMHNKAAVSEYYSVTIRGDATDVRELQDLLRTVTEEESSIGATIARIDADMAVGPQLSPGQDNVTIGGTRPTVVTGIVDGDADTDTSGSTFTAADRITGNGATELKLLVIEPGNAAFARLNHIDQVSLSAATRGEVQFNAAGWSGVGEVALNDGLGGMEVFVDHLRAGSGIRVEDVTGTISASFDRRDGDLFALVRNDQRGGAGGSVHVGTSGNVQVELGTRSAASISTTDEVSLGNVSVQGADRTTFDLSLGGGDKVATGNIGVQLGTASRAGIEVGDVDGEVALGAVSLSAGDAVSLDLDDIDGDASIGNVALAVGNGGTATAAFARIDGRLEAGTVSLTGGNSSNLSLSVLDVADASLGDVAMAGGDAASLAALFDGGGEDGSLALGDLGLSAGDDATVLASVWGAAQVAMGDAALSGGADASATLSVTIDGELGDLVAGRLQANTGDGGTSAIALGNVAAHAGSVTVEGLVAAAGNDGRATVTVTHSATGTADDDEPEVALGNLALGDIAVAAGNITDIDESAAATVTVLYGGKGGDLAGGDMLVGDIDASVGNGRVSGAQRSIAQANVVVGAIAGGDLGDVTIGDIALEGGYFASLALSAGAAALAGGSLGDGRIGDVSLVVGEGGSIALTAGWGVAGGGGSAGSFELGQAAVHAAPDADVAINVLHGNLGTAQAVGDLRLEGITAVLGDNADVAVNVVSSTRFGGLATDAGGDFFVGDISIGVSATETANLSGGSQVSVNLSRDVDGLAAGGAFTVGDVTLFAGDTALIDLDIGFSGNVDRLGDIALGTLMLSAGDESVVDARVSVRNERAAGKAGDFALAGLALDVGADSDAAVRAELAAAEFGHVHFGDVDLVLGRSASLDLSVGVEADRAATFSVGNVQAQLGTGATAALSAHADAATVGPVAVGDLWFDVARGGALSAGVTVRADTVGRIDAGQVFAAVTDGASADLVLDVVAGTSGAMTVGDVVLRVEDAGAVTTEGAALGGRLSLLVRNEGGAGADVTLGDLDVTVGGSAAGDEVAIRIVADGDLAIGDITVGGKGTFILDGAAHAADPNTSYLDLDVAGTVTIGNVDFSGHAGSAVIDLRFADAGAASIRGGAGDDAIWGTAGANVITAGQGVDVIDIGQGGNDTIVTSQGDSGKGAGTFDTIIGFSAGTVVAGALVGGDKLDFNLVAGSAGNYVERADNFTSLAEFTANARDALNSTVRYFVQDDGVDTYVAVNFGSGEADLIVVLAGVSDATTLQFQNFIA